MRLFIAEKPSVAKVIAAELGIAGKTASSIQCRDGSTVTWCFGHLLEQAEPDDRAEFLHGAAQAYRKRKNC